jgi:hypothetical protein
VAHGFHFIQTDYPWHRIDRPGFTTPALPLRPSRFSDLLAFREPASLRLLDATREPRFEPVRETRRWSDWQTLASSTRPTTDARYPNPREPGGSPRGKGCLRAAANASDPRADWIQVCRETGPGEHAEIRVELRRAGLTTSSLFADAGDLIRLTIYAAPQGLTCAASYAAADVDQWKLLATECFATPLPDQGLAAERGQVLFAGTRRRAAE